ncbi:D-glycero-beta-D-manno-heptose-7-phosphate kinase [Anaerovibrio sp. RM50]|uniref:D-glycero-beta-D-manno-heptose-7-phosphate kinase n=1 Tax=Anaerovibrio sp. RM50 TaxID=1200557 RepID=UPI0005615737|nr:D-glycero-beta-D-manno-heptose-7-phosphate kinase [Anaerovibrio sp. RM50]
MTTSKDRLKEFVTSGMSKVHILVVGDVMLDKYYYGEVTRISPEAPVPITRVVDTKDTMGGAANVAHNLALLGCRTSIAGFVGDDYHCQTLVDKFISKGIDYKGIIYREEPTTTKLRVIGGHQQMLRLDFEDTEPVKPLYGNRLINFVEQSLDDVDAVILSDYGKGACTDEVCESIIEMCNGANVPVLVDPKGRAWAKYTNADYITPNVKEINEILEKPIKNRDDAIKQAATYIMSKFKIKNVLVTRSECGMSMVTPTDTVHIPTKSQEVFDVSGAGDTVIAVFALGIAGGLIPREAAYLANLAASVVVAKLGTYAVSKDELESVLMQHIDSEEENSK